jgi:type I restriction enzyme R subunit
MNSILGDPDRLQALAEDFVKHYDNRVSEGWYSFAPSSTASS